MMVTHPAIKTAKGMTGTIHDYVEVPAIATRGEWPIAHLIADEQLAELAIMYRKMTNGTGW